VTTNLRTSHPASDDLVGCPSATPLSSDVLDLGALRNRCMGDLDLVQRVLKTFEERMPEEMETIEKALQLRDTEQIACVAHRVRGCSASMSADGLMRAAAEIEDAGRQGRLTDLPAGIERLHDEWEKYLDCAAALLSAADNT
jgi:HPt (histidine-containing phosphotransfer) domain-containing protein